MGSNRVKRGQTRRRLDAGEARDGGERRKRCSGHGLMRGWALRVAGDVAHPTVAVFGAGVAGVNGGELFCGRRSSGNLGVALQSMGGGVLGVYGFMRSC